MRPGGPCESRLARDGHPPGSSEQPNVLVIAGAGLRFMKSTRASSCSSVVASVPAPRALPIPKRQLDPGPVISRAPDWKVT